MTATPADARALSAMLTVDLTAVRENYRLLARRAAVPLVPMVKADAYGLGAVPVARMLEPERPFAFGVAHVEEGCELRDAGIGAPIIVFSPTLPAGFTRARSANLTLALSSPAHVATWTALGGAWHLAVDTGMNRAGVDWRDGAQIRAALTAGTPPAGVFTHFHSVDDVSVETQEARFRGVIASLDARPATIHAESSAVLLERDGPSDYDCARPGIALYGVSVGQARWRPRPVVTLGAPVLELRTVEPGDTVSYNATWAAPARRRIATVALGYADGLPRSAGNTATAVINGRQVPVVGLITMDMSMIDVTEVPCAEGDEVQFVCGDADESLTALAARAQRSPYELLTALRSRASRRHVLGPDGSVMGAAA